MSDFEVRRTYRCLACAESDPHTHCRCYPLYGSEDVFMCPTCRQVFDREELEGEE